MTRRRAGKRPEVARIAALVGEAEAEAYLALHVAASDFERKTGDRFFGGGGITLRDPKEVSELEGSFRPGLVGFARELAGDYVCWDVRRGPPKPGARPPIVYVDHEIGFATPFAQDTGGALVHIIAEGLVGSPRAERLDAAAHWMPCFGPILGARERSLLERLASKVAEGGSRPVFARQADATKFVRELLPRERPWLGILPLTHVPLLEPDSPKCLADAASRYEESLEVFREMVHVEGRSAYGWYLAAAARGLSDVLLRRKKFREAAEAAREAIAHYEPILAAGDGRVATMLAFAHRVVAVVSARSKRWREAYEHADRALDLNETALLELTQKSDGRA